MIETVAIQDEMTQQTSLLDHSEEQVQQGNGDNYKNAQGSSNTPQISTKSDDGKAETIYLVTESPLQNPRKKNIKEPRKSVKANVPTHKPEKWHESMNSSYITQLERKIRDRDNTIKLMERRLTQLEQNQDTPNTRDTNYCQHEYNPTQYHQHEYPRHQEFNCQLQHLTSNVRALEQQLTQHMCISTSLTTQLAMQLQQAMLTRQQTTTPNMVNANIPPAYGNLNHPFNNYMGYPNSLQQNFPFQPAHVGYPAHNQQQNSPYQTGPPAFNQQQNFPYQPVHIGQPSYFNQTSTQSAPMLNPYHQNGYHTNLQNPTTANYITPSFSSARPVNQDQVHQKGFIPMQQSATMTSQTMSVSTHSYGQQQQSSIYTNAKNQIPTQQKFYQQASSQPPNSHLQPTQPTLQHHSTPNTTGPDEIYTGNPEQPKAKDSPLPQDNRAKHQEDTPSTTHARQESKKEDSTNSTIKNSGLEKQNQGGKNYDLRDAIKQIEGIKLIQQEQQKKYFLTIPSLLKVPPNLHSLQMETEVSRI